jgi:hypothetical protein
MHRGGREVKIRIAILAGIFVLLSVASVVAQDVHSIMGQYYRPTVTIACDNSTAVLTTKVDAALVSAGSTAADWKMVKAATISCDTYDARITFGIAATATRGHLLAVGSSMRIPSNALINAAQVVNKTAGSAAALQVTLEF